MHYYKRHIGDYAKKAGHLSPLEHGVYNLIIDSYYDREKPPTLMEAMRFARARTEDEKAAVLAVLDEFFTLEGEVYRQKRIDEELGLYQEKAETNRVIAVEREQRKRERRVNQNSTEESRTVHGSCTTGSPEQHAISTPGQPNHKPLTTNQEPKEKVKTTVPPSGETAQVFAYWQCAMAHPQAKLDAKRERNIKARLKDGYTVEQLCRAVDGCKLSPHHMGQNETRTVYDDIELICRDGPRVDKFIALIERGVGMSMSPGLRQQVDVLQSWLEKQED